MCGCVGLPAGALLHVTDGEELAVKSSKVLLLRGKDDLISPQLNSTPALLDMVRKRAHEVELRDVAGDYFLWDSTDSALRDWVQEACDKVVPLPSAAEPAPPAPRRKKRDD